LNQAARSRSLHIILVTSVVQ